jgi:uncharacterized membrane protein
MTRPIERILHDYLKKLDIQIPYAHLKDLMRSHVNYPSILCITETLPILGIPFECLEIEKKMISEIPVPFLAHSGGNPATFFTINSKDETVNDNFLNLWDGIIIVAEKPIHTVNQSAEFKKAEAKEKSTKNKNRIHLLIAIIFLIGLILIDHSFTSLCLTLTGIMGIITSILILRQEYGYSDNFTQKMCRVSKYVDCERVLASGGATIIKGKLSLGDACFIYFSGFITCVIIATSANFSLENIVGLLAWISLLSIPITFYSIGYQVFNVKKWCVLCIIVIAILWIQGVMLIPHLNTNINYVSNGMKIICVGYVLSIVFYFVVKDLWKEYLKMRNASLKGIRFRKNFELFLPNLLSERRLAYECGDNEIQVGTDEAKVEIVIALSPFCEPCAGAQKKLVEIMRVFKSEIKIVYKFLITETESDQAVLHILKIIQHEPQNAFEIITTWYETLDINKFRQIYALKKEQAENASLISAQKSFFTEAKIEFTPTIFINGYQLPIHYSIEDLPFFIPGLINHFSTN